MLVRLKSYLRFERPARSIRELDGLRAIAILLVLLRHSVRPFYTADDPFLALGPLDLGTLAINGWAGVDLFFVLSGFLISHHILSRRDPFSPAAIRSYVAKRILRIVPAYYGTIALVLVGILPSIYPEDTPGSVWTDLLFLSDYYPSRLIVAFWSIGVEEKFYILIPFILAFLSRLPTFRAKAWALLGLALTPLALRSIVYAANAPYPGYAESFWMQRSPFHLAFDSLVTGTACALVYRAKDQISWVQNWPKVITLFICGSLAVSLLLFGSPLLEGKINAFHGTILFSVLAAGFGAVLLGSVLLSGSPFLAVLRSRVLFFFSKLSYVLYLSHMTVIEPVRAAMAPLLSGISPGSQYLLFLPIYLVAAVAVSLALHYLIEKPFLILKDRM